MQKTVYLKNIANTDLCSPTCTDTKFIQKINRKRNQTMEYTPHFTDLEREKCRKVADAFAELENEETSIITADAGRYGYVKLSHYDECSGFNKSVCFRDSNALFNALWQDWLNNQLFQIALETPSLMDLEYEDIFKSLPETKQQELMSRRRYFAKKSGIINA